MDLLVVYAQDVYYFYIVLLVQICMFKDIGVTHKVSEIGMTARCCSINYLIVSILSSEVS
jgi:hypothetical protein